MPRYTGQRDRFRCGPIVIANALKWAGVQVNYKWFRPALERLCQTAHPHRLKPGQKKGTHRPQIHEVLMTAAPGTFHVEYRHSPSLRDVERHLTKGGSVVLDYGMFVDGRRRRHVQLFTHYCPKTGFFRAVNARRKQTESVLTRLDLELVELKDRRREECHWEAWFLTKEESNG